MKISLYVNNHQYFFTNEDLKVGDEVWPLTSGYNENGVYYVSSITRDYFEPNEPHIIQNLKHSDTKSYEVRTNHGYGPRECYFKLIPV